MSASKKTPKLNNNRLKYLKWEDEPDYERLVSDEMKSAIVRLVRPWANYEEDCYDPSVILVESAKYLSNEDRRSLSQTCSRFRHLVLNNKTPDMDTRHVISWLTVEIGLFEIGLYTLNTKKPTDPKYESIEQLMTYMQDMCEIYCCEGIAVDIDCRRKDYNWTAIYESMCRLTNRKIHVTLTNCDWNMDNPICNEMITSFFKSKLLRSLTFYCVDLLQQRIWRSRIEEMSNQHKDIGYSVVYGRWNISFVKEKK